MKQVNAWVGEPRQYRSLSVSIAKGTKVQALREAIASKLALPLTKLVVAQVLYPLTPQS